MRDIKTFDVDENIDIEELAKIKPRSSTEDKDLVIAVAEKSNFSSRGDNKKKERKRSPYVIQKNIKMRIGMSELLTDLTKALNEGSDQETLEKAILALIEKGKLPDFEIRYKKIIAS